MAKRAHKVGEYVEIYRAYTLLCGIPPMFATIVDSFPCSLSPGNLSYMVSIESSNRLIIHVVRDYDIAWTEYLDSPVCRLLRSKLGPNDSL